jgi:hypothetical protein
MAHKRPLFTVECDALTAIDEDGNEYAPRAGEWVRFYRRMPAKLVRVLTQAAGFESASDEEAAGVMGEVLDDLVPRLAQAIHSWNWSDTWSENGAALPDPTEDVLWDLDLDELFWLAGKLFEATQAPLAPSSP